MLSINVRPFPLSVKNRFIFVYVGTRTTKSAFYPHRFFKNNIIYAVILRGELIADYQHSFILTRIFFLPGYMLSYVALPSGVLGDIAGEPN